MYDQDDDHLQCEKYGELYSRDAGTVPPPFFENTAYYDADKNDVDYLLCEERYETGQSHKMTNSVAGDWYPDFVSYEGEQTTPSNGQHIKVHEHLSGFWRPFWR